MKAKTIPSSWINREGRRLDCGPYMSGALETKIRLEKLSARKDSLQSLTKGHNGGIYNGPKFSRTWVDSPEYGVPFVGSSDMLMADQSGLPLLRKKDAESNKLSYLRLSPGMTLISCSGTIGRMVYARPDMDGIWSSQHIMKVVPDTEKIPSGYLYAYLSSKFGVPQVVSGTYGSIIQSIEAHHIADLPVPRLGDAVEQRAHALVEEAAQLRSDAAQVISLICQEMPHRLGLPPLSATSVSAFGFTNVQFRNLLQRFDAPYHSKAALETESALQQGMYPLERLTDVLKHYFKPPIFKRMWVDSPDYGRQFVSGTDAYRYSAEDVRYVSKKTPKFDEFILKRGWIVFQAAGQIYGLFGQPLYVHGWLENIFCADDMYRLVPRTEEDGAYLYAFFKTQYGQVLIKRQACGNSIPRVWDPHVSEISLPWPDEEMRKAIAKPIIVAHSDIDKARIMETEAIHLVEQAIEEAA